MRRANGSTGHRTDGKAQAGRGRFRRLPGKAQAGRGRFRRLPGKRRGPKLWRSGIAGALAVLFLLPMVLTFTNSFMEDSELWANYGVMMGELERGGSGFPGERVNLKLIPDMVSGAQYRTLLLETPDYLLKFWNSLILTAPVLVFQLAVALAAAYGFTRYRGRLREILFFTYLILMLLPFQVTLVPNFIVADYLHILDTRWAVWLPGIFSPFAVFLFTKYMRRLPEELWDAARTDGAGEWQIFTKVCVPLCRGILAAVAVLIFIDYWNMVEQPVLFLAEEELQPLSVFLSRISAEDLGLAFAAAMLYMVPGLLLFLYGEEYLVQGITLQGGLKG